MLVTHVPKTYTALVDLAVNAEAGALTLGDTIELEHNTSDMIAADRHDLTGNPATPQIPGKQAVLNSSKQTLKNAIAAAQVAKHAGREYCRLGIALLKPVLGTTYNSYWEAAGFITPSLAMPANPVPMLIQFRQFFEANPTRENAPTGVTAVQAHARMTAIQSTTQAVGAADAAKLLAKGARDLAQRTLAKRMVLLRGELMQVLSREDGRWKEFGFRRPADGKMPNDVEGLVLTAGTAGTVIARWKSARLAEQYRVVWRVAGTPIENAVEVGLFSDRQTLITGLASGSSVIVGVSARNSSGETDPTEATITVP